MFKFNGRNTRSACRSQVSVFQGIEEFATHNQLASGRQLARESRRSRKTGAAPIALPQAQGALNASPARHIDNKKQQQESGHRIDCKSGTRIRSRVEGLPMPAGRAGARARGAYVPFLTNRWCVRVFTAHMPHRTLATYLCYVRNIRVCVCVCGCMSTYVSGCIHTYVHTYIHTYIHTIHARKREDLVGSSGSKDG